MADPISSSSSAPGDLLVCRPEDEAQLASSAATPQSQSGIGMVPPASYPTAVPLTPGVGRLFAAPSGAQIGSPYPIRLISNNVAGVRISYRYEVELPFGKLEFIVHVIPTNKAFKIASAKMVGLKGERIVPEFSGTGEKVGTLSISRKGMKGFQLSIPIGFEKTGSSQPQFSEGVRIDRAQILEDKTENTLLQRADFNKGFDLVPNDETAFLLQDSSLQGRVTTLHWEDPSNRVVLSITGSFVKGKFYPSFASDGTAQAYLQYINGLSSDPIAISLRQTPEGFDLQLPYGSLDNPKYISMRTVSFGKLIGFSFSPNVLPTSFIPPPLLEAFEGLVRAYERVSVEPSSFMRGGWKDGSQEVLSELVRFLPQEGFNWEAPNAVVQNDQGLVGIQLTDGDYLLFHRTFDQGKASYQILDLTRHGATVSLLYFAKDLKGILVGSEPITSTIVNLEMNSVEELQCSNLSTFRDPLRKTEAFARNNLSEQSSFHFTVPVNSTRAAGYLDHSESDKLVFSIAGRRLEIKPRVSYPSEDWKMALAFPPNSGFFSPQDSFEAMETNSSGEVRTGEIIQQGNSWILHFQNGDQYYLDFPYDESVLYLKPHTPPWKKGFYLIPSGDARAMMQTSLKEGTRVRLEFYADPHFPKARDEKELDQSSPFRTMVRFDSLAAEKDPRFFYGTTVTVPFVAQSGRLLPASDEKIQVVQRTAQYNETGQLVGSVAHELDPFFFVRGSLPSVMKGLEGDWLIQTSQGVTLEGYQGGAGRLAFFGLSYGAPNAMAQTSMDSLESFLTEFEPLNRESREDRVRLAQRIASQYNIPPEILWDLDYPLPRGLRLYLDSSYEAKDPRVSFFVNGALQFGCLSDESGRVIRAELLYEGSQQNRQVPVQIYNPPGDSIQILVTHGNELGGMVFIRDQNEIIEWTHPFLRERLAARFPDLLSIERPAEIPYPDIRGRSRIGAGVRGYVERLEEARRAAPIQLSAEERRARAIQKFKEALRVRLSYIDPESISRLPRELTTLVTGHRHLSPELYAGIIGISKAFKSDAIAIRNALLNSFVRAYAETASNESLPDVGQFSRQFLETHFENEQRRVEVVKEVERIARESLEEIRRQLESERVDIVRRLKKRH